MDNCTTVRDRQIDNQIYTENKYIAGQSQTDRQTASL